MSTDVGLGEFFQREMNNIRSERDAFIGCIHYSLVSKGYGCIGNGEKLPPGSGAAAHSDDLPSDWSKGELCTLTYQHPNPGHLFLVKALSHNCVVLARFVDDKTFTLRVNPSLVISNDFTSFAKCECTGFCSAFTNLDQLWLSLESNQLKGFGIPADEESTCSEPLTTSTHRQQDSARKNLEHFLKAFEGEHGGLFTDDHKTYSSESFGPMAPLLPPFSGYGSGSGIEPLGIGQSDLSPLSGGYGGSGGGMIFDPLRQGGQTPIGGTGEVGGPDFLPRGSVPSGARFDPFSPPELDPNGTENQTTESDDDEHRPPGFDDMLM